MKTIGIIAEYNPFHNGHLYQIRETKKKTGADYVVVAMSGDYVQRGRAALINKYTRAEMALAAGADVVFELPTRYSCASAELFSWAGIRLLNDLNAVDMLSFGCENDQMSLLQAIADCVRLESDEYKQILNEAMKEGLSYPKARALAITKSITPDNDYAKPELNALLSSPNTILAIEYLKILKSIGSNMEPVAIKRFAAGHHDLIPNGLIASATAIRQAIATNEPYEAFMPKSSYDVLSRSFDENGNLRYLSMEDFYPYLQYALWEHSDHLTDFYDCNEDLANRLRKTYRPNISYQELCESLVHKQYTYTRIYRVLLHILLNITNDQLPTDMDKSYMDKPLPYARLLGFKQRASELMHQIKENSTVPIINSVADGLRDLKAKENTESASGVSMLQQDIHCAHLYEQVYGNRHSTDPISEYSHGVIIL